MGTGGGGGGKKGGSGGKKPPEDKIEIKSYPSKDEEDDSSLETSFELNVDPQQLASVGLDRPLLRLRITPRKRMTATAPGGGGTPPPPEGGTETVTLLERQNGTGYSQPIEGGGGRGTGPPLSERGKRTPQGLAGGGGSPLPGGNRGGNGNGDDNGGGDTPPLPRRNGGNGSDGGDDGDGGRGDDSSPPSYQGQP